MIWFISRSTGLIAGVFLYLKKGTGLLFWCGVFNYEDFIVAKVNNFCFWLCLFLCNKFNKLHNYYTF
ncbi:hypothetical protein Cst_c03800 [Thermoclostridium stercorarium subsp. stercorarium DSM 8532]|uniref:Uncharacterized protein n=2 Tax=Thermoclostridium stercorarium TaxID=1510 RepID=L7VPB6_THES1|nr:hypothetical protein Cst_c03800 [Thermoclostridium stercorarium subsp. stercorarium DSM 8532]ANX00445.1 hypothetical protein CSTERLE_01985 [Thermoclostridium stercorarium subsp. leptospartum DSM 9219]